jgi:predicted CxxxxCH...CXXCH cytochrome family protein
MSREETVMSTVKMVLIAGLSTLIMVFWGCSTLEKDFIPTVRSVENEACGSCHLLRQENKDHFVHMYDTAMEPPLPMGCRDCHKGYDDSLGWIDASFHRNGLIDTCQADCDYCHTYRGNCFGCHNFPPDTTARLVKIHRHYTLQNMKCGDCHKGYDYDKKIAPKELHDNGRVDVVFDVLQKPGFSATPYFSNDSCYNLYCHGAATKGGKPAVAVNDTKPQGAPDQCNFCHDLDGLYQLTEAHMEGGLSRVDFQDCLICHAGFSANLPATVDSLHRNGRIDTIPKANRVR